MLHGAGVAGEDTWQALLAQLDMWSEVLVPDLRGMGQTVSRMALSIPILLRRL
ncbi:hypothetical protein [Aliamphritea spongicola]|nr:hypothetical protein [Aliamphritea spongicola]